MLIPSYYANPSLKPVTSNTTILPATVYDTGTMNCSAVCTYDPEASLTAKPVLD